MSTMLPELSALDARTQAFPVLTPAQIDRIRHCGQNRRQRWFAQARRIKIGLQIMNFDLSWRLGHSKRTNAVSSG